MLPSPHVTVHIDLERIRQNAQSIKTRTRVPLIAVIKADAYGLGATRIAEALRDIVDRFCVFRLSEAVDAGLWTRLGKSSLTIGADSTSRAEDYLAHHVRPAVWTVSRAAELHAAKPVLAVDTGMQRFGCPSEQIEDVLRAGACDEAFTHATTLDRVHRLIEMVGDRGLTIHAAGSSLLHEPSAWLDAVRPGFALYDGAARVATRLIEARTSAGPIGYTGFSATHHGVIEAGYANGLRPGPCLVNGRVLQICEVGMQSAYVQTQERDKVGDEVILLGESLPASQIAKAWNCGPHEVLTRLCRAGPRVYEGASGG